MGQEMGSMFTARRRPSSGRRWLVGCRRLLLLRFFWRSDGVPLGFAARSTGSLNESDRAYL